MDENKHLRFLISNVKICTVNRKVAFTPSKSLLLCRFHVVSEVQVLGSLTISFDMSNHPRCPQNQKGEGIGDNKTEK